MLRLGSQQVLADFREVLTAGVPGDSEVTCFRGLAKDLLVTGDLLACLWLTFVDLLVDRYHRDHRVFGNIPSAAVMFILWRRGSRIFH